MNTQKQSSWIQKDSPLIPQPSNSSIDPLNYPNWLKYIMLLELSFLGFASGASNTLPSPAVREISREFHVSANTVVIPSLIPSVVGTLAGIILIPFGNVYGHRFLFLAHTLVSFAFKIAAAKSTSFMQYNVYRSLAGISTINGILAVAAVSNLFYAHQMGRAIGIYIVLSHHGGHVGPIAGGFMATYWGWRWTFWVGAIIMGIKFITTALLLPETLFQRPTTSYTCSETKLKFAPSQSYKPPPMQLRTYLRCLKIMDRERMPNRGVRLSDICIRPFQLLRYPSILLPAVCCAVVNTFSNTGPVAIAPTQFAEAFNFTSAQSGLATGITVVIGSSIGELFSGMVTDHIIGRSRKNSLKGGRSVEPELRLRGIWLGAVIVPLGLLMCMSIWITKNLFFERGHLDGFTLQYSKSFLGPCVALAFTCVGAQIITSVLYTYACSDCYPSQSSNISQIFHLVRSLFSLALPFYEKRLVTKLGYHLTFTVFAAMCIVTFVGIGVLSVKGPEWRANAPKMPED